MGSRDSDVNYQRSSSSKTEKDSNKVGRSRSRSPGRSSSSRHGSDRPGHSSRSRRESGERRHSSRSRRDSRERRDSKDSRRDRDDYHRKNSLERRRSRSRDHSSRKPTIDSKDYSSKETSSKYHEKRDKSPRLPPPRKAEPVVQAPPEPTRPTATKQPSTEPQAAPETSDFAKEAAKRVREMLAKQQQQGIKSVQGISKEIKFNGTHYSADLDINDIKFRFILTKDATRQQIKDATGADLEPRGKYYPDKSLANEMEPPLYLHITATSKQSIDQALKKIDDFLGDAEKLAASGAFSSAVRAWEEAKVPIGMDPLTGFNLRNRLIGPNGSYVKHINAQTSARLQLKGLGSGFFELDGKEANEPLFLHVTAMSGDAVEKAVALCKDLLKSIRVEYDRFIEMQANQQGMGGVGYGYPPPPPGMAPPGGYAQQPYPPGYY